MLILTRKKNERLLLRCPQTGAVIAEICIVEALRGRVRIGITADRQAVSIDRPELLGNPS